MKNQNIGKSWNISGMLSKTLYRGLTLKGAYSYGEARNTIDPGSTAFASWAGNETAADPNNPGLGFSSQSQGHRVFVQTSYSRSYFKLRHDVDRGVLGNEAFNAELQHHRELRVCRRHERRRRL